MATDQRLSTAQAEAERADSAIPNELPTYRAISKQAIFSVAFGLLSICSFAHPAFYAFAFVAVGLGILAQRSIQRYPDILTGRGLANAGIAMGLVFGLFSGTVSTVQYFVRKKHAEEFAKKYAEVLKTPSFGDVLWYNSHPDLRKDKTGAQLLAEHEARPKERQLVEMNMGPLAEILALRARLASSASEKIEFVEIEEVGEEDSHGNELQIYALALFRVEGPGNAKIPGKTQYALAILKARPAGREFEWWTQSVRFPYTPKTYVPPAAPVGDGHDHAAGEGH